MKVNFVSKLTEKNEILALISDEKSLKDISGLNKNLLERIQKTIKNENFKFNKFSTLEITNDKLGSFTKIILISPGQKTSLSTKDFSLIGGKILQISSKSNSKKINVITAKEFSKDENLLKIGYGAILNTYRFDKYKTKKVKIIQINELKIISKNATKLKKNFKHNQSLAEGVFLARDLVNEPSNILNPEAYAKRIRELSKYGLKIETLNETKMKKLGMWSLLGVGRGSQYESHLIS